MPEPKAPYKLTVNLDGAKPERIAGALTELRETAGAYDQTGEASATMTIEAYQERPLHALIDAFEDWLYRNAQGLDVDIKLQRPGIRPETIAQRMREKHETPMDKEWQEFADRNGTEVHGTLFGKRIDVTPGEQVMEWIETREQD